MELPAVDPRLSAQQALQDDPVQRKLQIDALRERLAEPGKDDAAARKLKEACQGFESIFLQRIWEQMRKSVGKEGYLHSRDEESYQSMFDQELAKKMAEAGGIGLADMLQEQLSVKLGKASIASSPGMLKGKQQLLPLEDLAMPLPTVPGFNDQPKAKAEELYTPLEKEAEKQPEAKAGQKTVENLAVAEDSLGTHPDAARSVRNSSLSAMTQPVGELAKQPALGMQSQFMLGASMLTRSPSASFGDSVAQNMAEQAGSQAENALLPEMNRIAGQISAPNPTGTEAALAQANSLPPLPQLDNNPTAGRRETAPGQLTGAADQPMTSRVQRRAEHAPNLSGITMVAEDPAKKSQPDSVAQSRPVAETTGNRTAGQNRFAGRIGRPLHAAQPEVGRAELEEPSILQPPMGNMGRTQAPRNEAEIMDIAPPHSATERHPPGFPGGSGSGPAAHVQLEQFTNI